MDILRLVGREMTRPVLRHMTVGYLSKYNRNLSILQLEQLHTLVDDVMGDLNLRERGEVVWSLNPDRFSRGLDGLAALLLPRTDYITLRAMMEIMQHSLNVTEEAERMQQHHQQLRLPPFENKTSWRSTQNFDSLFEAKERHAQGLDVSVPTPPTASGPSTASGRATSLAASGASSSGPARRGVAGGGGGTGGRVQSGGRVEREREGKFAGPTGPKSASGASSSEESKDLERLISVQIGLLEAGVSPTILTTLSLPLLSALWRAIQSDSICGITMDSRTEVIVSSPQGDQKQQVYQELGPYPRLERKVLPGTAAIFQHVIIQEQKTSPAVLDAHDSIPPREDIHAFLFCKSSLQQWFNTRGNAENPLTRTNVDTAQDFFIVA